MKQSSAEKAAHAAAPTADPATAAGPEGAALAPPAYGVQLVDHGLDQGGLVPSQPVQRQENRTGLPDALKAGVEQLSGLALDDVRVYYNSPRPAQLQARAYTQGAHIHVGPGQQRHLPHEAWHVVQQKQGRVPATVQSKGLAVNYSQRLEREADVKGAQAVQMLSLAHPVAGGTPALGASARPAARALPSPYGVVQMRTWSEWFSEVGSMAWASLWGWLTDIPMRLRNIFIDLPVSLVHDLSPLVTYIGQAVAGQDITANLGNAAATLFGSLGRAALRFVFGVLDLLPLTPIFEIINVAINQHLRPMSAGELAAANWTFGARPNLWSRVHISHDDQFLLKVFSYVVGGDWDAFIGLATYHMIRLQDQSDANANLQNTVHELGHIVQFDRRGATYTMAEAAAHGALRGYSYTYPGMRDNPLRSFGREQQCRIAEHGWAVHHGGHPNDYLGTLPTGAQRNALVDVQAAYNRRLVEWRANDF